MALLSPSTVRVRPLAAMASRVGRAIVPFDFDAARVPLRRLALTKFDVVEELSGRLADYEQRMVPFFESWRREALGELIEEHAALERRIERLSWIVQRVQFEVSFSGRAPAPVYERVLREAEAGGEEDEAAPVEADAPPAGPPPRLKALYRALVRCFHPDMAGGGGRAIALWHELQAAYARGDLARMEVLAVFADMRDAGFVRVAPGPDRMRRAVEGIDETIERLSGRLGEARRSKAWQFWHSRDRPALETMHRRHMEIRVADARRRLERLERIVSRWKKPPRAPRAQQAGWSGATSALRQALFDFRPGRAR
jgi:hypothetical protein